MPTASDSSPKTIGIIGLGLIGGSVGLALRQPGTRILGYDLSVKAAETASARFCVDEIAEMDVVCNAGVVFLTVPPNAVCAMGEEAVRLAGPETVITDCCSVKAEVAAWAEKRKLKNFVPGHPMAGHEKSGPEYASAWLFRGARWLLTPTKFTSFASITKVQKLVREMGATTMRLEPETHDKHVALLSHLPHVLAAAAVHAAKGLEHIEVGAGSWRDITRVGGVDPDLWSQIMMGNRHELAAVLAEFEGTLRNVRTLLEMDDRQALWSWLKESQELKAAQTPVIEAAAPDQKRPTRTSRRRFRG